MHCTDTILDENEVNWFDGGLTISGKVNLVNELGIYNNGENDGVEVSLFNSEDSNLAIITTIFSGDWEIKDILPNVESELKIFFEKENYSPSLVLTSHVRGVPVTINDTVKLYEIPSYTIKDFTVSLSPDTTSNDSTGNDTIRIVGNFPPFNNNDIDCSRSLLLCFNVNNLQGISPTNNDASLYLSSFPNTDLDSCFIKVDYTENYITDSLNVNVPDSYTLYFKIYPVNALYESSGYIDPKTGQVSTQSIGVPTSVESVLIQ